MNLGRLWRLDQAADFLSTSKSSIRRLIYEGQISGIKIRGSLRVFEGSVRAYLERQKLLFALILNESVADAPDVAREICQGPLDVEQSRKKER